MVFIIAWASCSTRDAETGDNGVATELISAVRQSLSRRQFSPMPCPCRYRRRSAIFSNSR